LIKRPRSNHLTEPERSDLDHPMHLKSYGPKRWSTRTGIPQSKSATWQPRCLNRN
jgi:hypothetical protein